MGISNKEAGTHVPWPFLRYIYDMYLIGAIHKLLIKISNGDCVPVMNYIYIYIFWIHIVMTK
jgi:hypothetical protein